MNGDGWLRGFGAGWHTVPTNPIGGKSYTMSFLGKMVRNPKRKSSRASQPHDIVLRAIKEVRQEKRSIRATAMKYDIPFRSLARYCAKISDDKLNDAHEFEKLIGYQPNRKVYFCLKF